MVIFFILVDIFFNFNHESLKTRPNNFLVVCSAIDDEEKLAIEEIQRYI
jgi:hypothetical protein